MDDTAIALITYNRPKHTAKVLKALQKQKVHNLFIFSDGPKTASDKSSVEETRQLFDKIEWTHPTVFKREHNHGLAWSIVAAADKLFETFPRLIVLEDDCVPQPFFFEYMQSCLNRYEHNKRIFGISGYGVPLENNLCTEYPFDIYFFPRIGTWGWATWRRAWKHFERDLQTAYDQACLRDIDLSQGGTDVPLMIKSMLAGNLKDVWSLNWMMSLFLHQGLYVYPTRSHIDNIGMDGSGVHCGASKKYQTTIANTAPSLFPSEIAVDRRLSHNFRRYYDLPQRDRSPSPMRTRPFKVVHLNTIEFGGAAKAACRLHDGLLTSGIDSTLIVLETRSASPHIKALPFSKVPDRILPAQATSRQTNKTRRLFQHWQENLQRFPDRPKGLELFSDTHAVANLKNVKDLIEADLIHLHWVAGLLNYQDLPAALFGKPVVWTLHDMNPFTGGCHYANDCILYEKACGNCPQIGSNDHFDLSRSIWHKKQQGLRNLDLTVVTPSEWLKNCMERSSLMTRCPVQTIANGIPTDVFQPRDIKTIRKRFDLPEESRVILFGAADIHNERKGFRYFIESLSILKKNDSIGDDLRVVVFGNSPNDQKATLPFPMLSIGPVNDDRLLSDIYSMADVFVLPSTEDNLPNTAIESMSCGTPVVGFNAGGIAEIVDHKKTGFLAERGDPEAMAYGIRWLLSDQKRHRFIRRQCRKSALKRYDHRKQAKQYQSLYQEVISRHTTWEKGRLAVVDDHNQRAEDFASRGDWPSALKECRSALVQNPGVAKTHNNLAVAYSHSDVLSQALYHHNVAHLLDPGNKTFAKNFADMLWFTRRDAHTALPIYRRFLQNDPEDVEILYALGCISEEQGKHAQAQEFFRRIIALKPHDESARQALRRLTTPSNDPSPFLASANQYRKIEAMLSASDRDSALPALQAFVRKFPDFPQAQNDLGVFYAQKHELKQALKCYSHAVALDPVNPLFRKNLADFYIVALGRIPEAMAIYTDILKLDPVDEEALLGMAFAAHRIGNDADGLEFLELCLKVNPDNRDARALKSAIGIKHSTEANRHPINKGEFQRPATSDYHDHGKEIRPSVSAMGNTGHNTSASKSNVDFHEETIEQRYHEKLDQRNIFRVSAVVSTYASERFIEDRLQNLIEQTLFQKGELEIVVVDSNSPENEGAIVERFAAQYPNFFYLRTPERETVYAAWNRGIEMARGTYFVNANTDDQFSPDALEFMADSLDAHPEYDAAYGNWVFTRTPNDTFESSAAKRLFAYPEFHPGLFFYLQITSHASFVRRSVIDKIGPFDGAYTVFGDREFMFRFSAAGHKALKLNKTIGLYLENPTSVERTNKDIGMQECAALYDAYLIPEQFARLMGHDHGVSPKALSRAYSEAGCFGMGLYQINGNTIHALGSPTRLFAMAIEMDPGNIEALNNMGVIAQHRQASQDALRFLENAKAHANDKQIKAIDHNQKLVRRGISDPDQLRFLYPSDFQAIKIVETKYHSNSQGISLGDNRSTYFQPKGPINKKRQKKKSGKKHLAAQENRRQVTFTPPHFGSTVDDKIWPAWCDYLKENHTLAQLSLHQLLTEHPNHWAAYELLVDVMLQSGQEACISDQLRPLEDRTDIPAWAHALIGCGYEAANDLERASAFADQALSIAPECARAWNLKGVIAYRNGNPQDAAHFFQKASECGADWGDPWTNMGTIHWENGTHERALDCYEKGFHLSPTAPNIATTYHGAISEMNQFERAKPLFEQAVKLHPNFRKAHFLLIDILIRLEAYHEALDHIEAVLVIFGADLQFLEAAKVIRAKVGPVTIKKGRYPSLSLCMIVKNEEKYLARCLKSLKPLVDDMIIVDTGSTDATRDIAGIFGAKVFDFQWQDDFAAARNHSLEKATGDWILIMDADEVIATTDHNTIIDLIKKPQNDKVAYVMTTRNYTDRQDSADYTANEGQYAGEMSTGWVPSKKVRLFQNNHAIQFVYPVHEQVDPVLAKMGIPLFDCPVPIHHYGKMDQNRISERWQLYYTIGKKKLLSKADNSNALREIAIQAGLLSKWKEASTYWKKYLEKNPDAIEAYLNLTRVLANCGDFPQANRYARNAFELESSRFETNYNLALSELQMGHAGQAAAIAREIVKAFPDELDGKLFCAFVEICTDLQDDGRELLQSLVKQIPKELLDSRTKAILSAIRFAGYDDWSARLIPELSIFDNLKDIQIANLGSTENHTGSIPEKTVAQDMNLSKLYDEADQFYTKEDYKTAYKFLLRVITINPGHWAAYELLVDVMLQYGLEMDIPSHLRPLENWSDLPARMMALIGHGYEASGNLEKAAAFAARAIAIDSECARAWNLKGVIAYQNRHGSEAARFFQKASECDENWGDPWTNMGTLHWDRGDQDKALDCFETGFQLSPTGPNVATTYHIAISETGQYKRAREPFEKIVSRYPDFRIGRFLLVDVLIRLEAYHAALDQIEAVLVRFGANAQLLEAAKAVRTKVGHLTIKKNKHPSLSLCMIVKNEEKYLARCLASLKPMVDEMIIVDTGSTDASRIIAEVFGAKVFDYEWKDDFAAARNHSLEKATGDWILIMDADEVIAAKDHEKLRKLIVSKKKHQCAFMVVTRNYTDQYNIIGWEPNKRQYPEAEAGTGWIPSEKVRLFPNDMNIRFEYPVHEVVGPSLARMNISIVSCPYPVHHYGKLDHNKEIEKDLHYFNIGIKKLTSDQNDPVPIRELAIQATKLGKHEASIELWKKLIKIEPKNAKCYINMATSYAKLKQYPDAQKAAQIAVKLSPELKEGHLNLGLSELHLGHVKKAEKIFYNIVKKHHDYYSAIFLLVSTQLCQGKTKEAANALRPLKGSTVWDKIPHAIQDLVESLGEAGWTELTRNLIVGSMALDCSNRKIMASQYQLENEAA